MKGRHSGKADNCGVHRSGRFSAGRGRDGDQHPEHLGAAAPVRVGAGRLAGGALLLREYSQYRSTPP